MSTKNNQKGTQANKPTQIVDLAQRILNPEKNLEEPAKKSEIKSENKSEENQEKSKGKPVKKVKRQATQEQLNNPLHGVKLAQILERLVDHYGWEYLADVVNIRCFKYNPTMKSSLGFLRKMQWAREHVEDVYLDMLEERGERKWGVKYE